MSATMQPKAPSFLPKTSLLVYSGLSIILLWVLITVGYNSIPDKQTNESDVTAIAYLPTTPPLTASVAQHEAYLQEVTEIVQASYKQARTGGDCPHSNFFEAVNKGICTYKRMLNSGALLTVPEAEAVSIVLLSLTQAMKQLYLHCPYSDKTCLN